MPFRWWFDSATIGSGRGVGHVCSIPIWFLAMLTAMPTFLMWRHDRNLRMLERANACPKCGYDRTGLPVDRACPECGSANGGANPAAQ
jgi:hypothetical protein